MIKCSAVHTFFGNHSKIIQKQLRSLSMDYEKITKISFIKDHDLVNNGANTAASQTTPSHK